MAAAWWEDEEKRVGWDGEIISAGSDRLAWVTEWKDSRTGDRGECGWPSCFQADAP